MTQSIEKMRHTIFMKVLERHERYVIPTKVLERPDFRSVVFFENIKNEKWRVIINKKCFGGVEDHKNPFEWEGFEFCAIIHQKFTYDKNYFDKPWLIRNLYKYEIGEKVVIEFEAPEHTILGVLREIHFDIKKSLYYAIKDLEPITNIEEKEINQTIRKKQYVCWKIKNLKPKHTFQQPLLDFVEWLETLDFCQPKQKPIAKPRKNTPINQHIQKLPLN